MIVLVPDEQGVELLGELPPEVDLRVYAGEDPGPPDTDLVEVVVPGFLDPADLRDLLHSLPRLRLVQALTAGVERLVDAVPPGVALCDARGAHSPATAEWVVAVTLAMTRELPTFVRAQAAGEWDFQPTGSLAGSTVLIVGAGSIGAAVEARLAGFDVDVLRVARTAREGVFAIDELPGLLPRADVVVVLVPLTETTRGLVDAAFLGRMRDGALLVNAARGPVVDTDALLAELSAGRLRAAVDVTDPEPLPTGHPLWGAPGLLLTPHVAGSTPAAMPRAYAIVRDQLERLVAGKPLVNLVEGDY